MKRLLNSDEFKDIIKEGTWLVDFSATWCGPCRMLEPNLEELSKEYNVLKVDIDQFMELAESYSIVSVPTLMLFKDGELIKQSSGYRSLDELKKFMNIVSTLKK
jgi:thioredoxin 1